ncbi:MAG: aspartate aminotransferase family protein [Candidatus Omnitrophica bacterium]|nr:aspartate aminotransferase family protein [Candidatus Omnitrophota bacterium]
MNNQDIANLYSEFVLPTYKQHPVCLVKGKGSRVWDIQGKAYLDFFPGWGVSGIGHCHPVVIHAIKEQVRKIIHVPNNFLNLKQAQLAKEISKRSFPSRVFFCNSGAEAIESAIKFARKFGSEEGRYEIISMEQSFHGRTLAALTATGQEKFHHGFEPLVSGFRYAQLNNFESVKRLVNEKTVAILLELIQGEGGIHVATQEFVKKLEALCKEKNLLLIFDEVQTGMGRTGKWFVYQHYGIEPDLMVLAKTLGGGAPIGALVAHKRIQKEVLTPGTHASTYGGNPLAASASLAVFKAVEREKLLQNAQEMGIYLKNKLEELKTKYSIIKEVRGIGLMLGVELSISGVKISNKCMERGLLINCTQEKVLRIVPAMTVSKRLIDQAVRILDQVLGETS